MAIDVDPSTMQRGAAADDDEEELWVNEPLTGDADVEDRTPLTSSEAKDSTEQHNNSYFALLKRSPDFTKLWLAACISSAGDWFTLALLAGMIEAYSASTSYAGFAITFFLIARTLPPMLSSSFGGVLLDRYDRRTLLIASSAVRAALAPFYLLATGTEWLPLIYGITCLMSLFSGIYEPGESALIPSLVDGKKDAVLANTFMSVSWSFVAAFGAMLGGYCSSLLGKYASIGIDTASFIIGSLLVYSISPNTEDRLQKDEDSSDAEQNTQTSSDDDEEMAGAVNPEDDDDDEEAMVMKKKQRQRPTKSDKAEEEVTFANGVRYALARPVLLVAMLTKFCFVSLDFTTINIVLAAQVYPIGENGQISSGLIWSAFGIGAIVGPWLSSKISDGTPRMILKINSGMTVLGVTSAWSLLWLAVSLNALWGIDSVPMAVAIMSLSSFARGCYSCTLWTNSQVLLQLTAKNKMLGRMFGIDWIFLNIGQVYSTLVQGAMIDVFGLDRINLILAMSLAAGLLPNIPWFCANLYLANKQQDSDDDE